ncbi:TIGR02678 family protein [Planotetraspora sp. A-T 1434]|uniref:TIGR02678 family protein n=1 Tax=Planotetraspora sp. A-T 1434 TaxID=2979219 RepID=UPI0021BF8175|nr:TIGR02678 family protein [Planotetraspora sp. A-T 1434]MCT9934527.1 TIGR02678 family protein [Planotetraspora sp. A-T 1434]
MLARPLLHRRATHAYTVELARAHQAELQAWFEHHLGWQLRVERDRVRLFKVPGNVRRQGSDAPTARQCALFCLILAVLEDCGTQTVISELAQKIEVVSRTHPNLRRFDATVGRERRDLVLMLRLMCRQRVLVPTLDTVVTQEDEQDYIRGVGDALYDVDHRTAALMLGISISPSLAAGPQELLMASGVDGMISENRALHHAVMRRLVDDPVVYFDDLPTDQREYFLAHMQELVQALRAGLGVRVEVRAEGAAIVDEELTDLEFPKTSAASFAALVMAERLFREVADAPDRTDWIGATRLLELSSEVAARLSKAMTAINQKPVDGEHTWQAVAPILIGLELIITVPGGILVRPALARYRDPSGRGPRAEEAGLMLFGIDDLLTPSSTDHPTPEEPSDDTLS